MSAKFTRGPWKAWMNCDVMAGERLVAVCMTGWLREDRANAHHIAAAPEMLEALEAMVEMVEMNGLGKRYALDLAASAIRKARGVDEASVPDCIKRLSRSGEMEVQK